MKTGYADNIARVALSVALGQACTSAHNRTVSATRPGGAEAVQGETSMVRVPNANGAGIDRLVVGYNDYQGTLQPIPDGGFDMAPGTSRMGWAYSNTQGKSWIAGPQIPVGANLPAEAALYGDPYLAESNGTVLYVGLAARGAPISDVVLSRWRPGQAGFQPALSIYQANVGAGEQVDGPKIAVEPTGANPRAVVPFLRLINAGLQPPGYLVFEDVSGAAEPHLVAEGTLTFPGIHFPLPCLLGVSPPSTAYSAHPEIAVGRHGFAYIGVQSTFSNATCAVQQRIEIYRADLHTLPIVWTRILSRPAPERDGRLVTSVANEVSRRGVALSIGVAQSGGHDVVGIAVENLTGTSTATTSNDQRIRFIRRSNADTCVVVDGLDGCDGAEEIDPELSYQASITIGGTPIALNAPRVGVQRVQPSIVSTPGDDGRMAIYWYAQPWAYWNLDSLPNRRHRFLTTVEGLVSQNAGAAWGPLRRLAVFNYSNLEYHDAGVPQDDAADGDGSDGNNNAYDRSAGLMFEPCLFQVRGTGIAPNNRFFFGDYMGGTFLSGQASDLGLYGTWSDSRNGCVQRTSGYRSPVMHQHVAGGHW